MAYIGQSPFSTIPSNSVGTASIVDNAVTTSKLAVTSVNAGSYGNATLIPTFTIGVDGRISYAANISLSSESGGATITDDTTTNADTFYPVMADNQTSGSFADATVSSTKLYFNPSTGILNATDFNSLSDLTLKTDINPINNAIDIIKQLGGYEFKWKDTSRKSAGVIAQDVESVLPHAVNKNLDGIRSVNYGSLTAYLIQCIKELTTRLEELEKKNGS